MSGQATIALEALQRAATERLDAERDGKTRVVAQVGFCSEAVGAATVATTLAVALPGSATISVAGCDGACFAAPQVVVTAPDGTITRHERVTAERARLIADDLTLAGAATDSAAGFLAGQRRVALDGCGEIVCTGIDDYLAHGGYLGAARALEMSSEDVIAEVKASGLRGRGGAYFPAALKWESVRRFDKGSRYVVVNCEEGEPGIFKDRHLMEGVPHRIVEGTIIAAYASDASEAFIYVNAEAELSNERMGKAVDDARECGLLGDDILGSGFDLHVELRQGAGGYVCGEEMTLLNTMEGDRREPRPRPPFPTESGLRRMPTVINNAETLASVPFVLTEGPDALAGIGSDDAKGTKIVSVSGAVRRSGVAEVPMGATLRDIVMGLGDGVASGSALTGIAVGGPSSGVFPPSMLDTPIGPGLLHESGVMLGAGGVIALDERVPPLAAMRHLAAYNAAESCGKCTPCREGTPRMVEALDRLAAGQGSTADLDELRYLAEVVGLASLCGLGQAAGGPINSALHFFGEELAALAGRG